MACESPIMGRFSRGGARKRPAARTKCALNYALLFKKTERENIYDNTNVGKMRFSIHPATNFAISQLIVRQVDRILPKLGPDDLAHFLILAAYRMNQMRHCHQAAVGSG